MLPLLDHESTSEGGILAGHSVLASPLELLIIQILVIAAVSRLLSWPLKYIYQPAVVKNQGVIDYIGLI